MSGGRSRGGQRTAGRLPPPRHQLAVFRPLPPTPSKRHRPCNRSPSSEIALGEAATMGNGNGLAAGAGVISHKDGHVPLVPHALACHCGYGQLGDNGPGVDRTDPAYGKKIKEAFDAGSKWDGKTIEWAPEGVAPSCPNCQGRHDPTFRDLVAPGGGDLMAKMVEQIAPLPRHLADLPAPGRPPSALPPRAPP